MKAMMRLLCLKVWITLKCKIKCTNNNMLTTINNLTNSSFSPKIRTATAKNLILQDSVVVNKLTNLILRDQSEALFSKAKIVTYLWVNQQLLESMLLIHSQIQGSRGAMITRKNTHSHLITRILIKTTHTPTRCSNQWQKTEAILSNLTYRTSKRAKTATMMRMIAAIIRLIQKINLVMKMIPAMTAVSQTTILVKK
jgi:hypothetical protein